MSGDCCLCGVGVQVLQQEVERLEVRAALVEEEAGRSGQLEEEAATRTAQLRVLQEKVRHYSSTLFFGDAVVILCGVGGWRAGRVRDSVPVIIHAEVVRRGGSRRLNVSPLSVLR